jgi:hypothetical protein
MEENPQVYPDEALLAQELTDRLKALETVTTTAAVAAFDVRVSVVDLNARATGPGLKAIEQGLEHILKEELYVVVQSLVAQKRHDVDNARKDLLEYQFRTLQQGTETPLALHDLAEGSIPDQDTYPVASNGQDKSEAKPAPIAAEILGEEVYF